MSADRGNWPRWYGVCRLSDGARSDIARWAFYNIGAHMTAREHLEPRTVALPACSFCGAPDATDVYREDLFADMPCCADEDACWARVQRDDPEPQGESVRLFEPAPSQLPGQLAL